MKLAIIVFPFLFCQCSPPSEHQNSDQKDSINLVTTEYEMGTTALPVSPLHILPAGYTLDSLTIIDSTCHFTSTMYFPHSTTNDELNKLIQDFVKQQIEAEKPDSETTDPTTFELWVTELRTDEKIATCKFQAQTYTQGAAHYNHSILCLNFKNNDKKRLLFTDLFKFSNKNSKQLFCDIINRYEMGLEDNETYTGGLSPEELTKELNFEILENQLIIYPNYCCADESKTYSVELKLIEEFYPR
ncbi:MAG: hypothetical protein CVU05_06090 [Bacteroidetes bacterium HGW-Bacteroidetes-21]|jgi:hypothetical protein|nr:MAG: hypothetical protein CVU05_06090 [Bacteroidetes bacterium HGW-Bacteroidetes-21]